MGWLACLFKYFFCYLNLNKNQIWNKAQCFFSLFIVFTILVNKCILVDGEFAKNTIYNCIYEKYIIIGYLLCEAMR